MRTGINSRVIESAADIEALAKLLRARDLPVTVSIRKGKTRSTAQNKLQQQWFHDAATQLDDRTEDDMRALCKLHYGIPIMRRDDANFCASYDRIVRPMPYRDKLELMLEPFDFPVTRLMTSKQKTEYLDTVHRELSGMGVVLTNPDDLKWNAA